MFLCFSKMSRCSISVLHNFFWNVGQEKCSVGEDAYLIYFSINTEIYTYIYIYIFLLLLLFRYFILCAHSVMSNSVTQWAVTSQAPLSMGFFQARILEWVAVSSSRGSSRSKDQTLISCIGRHILYHWAIWETTYSHYKILLKYSTYIRLLFWSSFELHIQVSIQTVDNNTHSIILS